MDLAQPCQPLVKFRESTFKHLTMAGILHGLKLLKHAPAREFKRFARLLPGRLFRCKSLFRFDLCADRCLLLLHGLALPPAGHGFIIVGGGLKIRICLAPWGHSRPENDEDMVTG